MPSAYTRADALREYLSGANSDGGSQTDPALSLGGYYSSTEAVSMGVVVQNALSGVSVLFASGSNPVGTGTLTAVDANNLTWKPAGGVVGAAAVFNGVTQLGIVESDTPGQYLRLSVTTPLSPGTQQVVLNYLYDNVFGMEDVSVAFAASGGSSYRCTFVRNESTFAVTAFQRWLSLLGTPQTSNFAFLASSGGGNINTSRTFFDWPTSGWAQVRSAGGTLKEVIYYYSRTSTSLTVPASGRALLGTSATAGAPDDVIYPVPGVAMAMDPVGVMNFGTPVQLIGSVNTPPASVTWNKEITADAGVQLGTLLPGQQVAIWSWRHIPAGMRATPYQLVACDDSFNSF